MTAAPPMPHRPNETVLLRAEIEAELERICISDQFRYSRRSCEFLRHVVKVTLEGKTDALKERSIGMELLGRDTSYEPSADSAVRVRANDVRKRLVGFYSVAPDSGALRIALPSGTYVPQFLPPIIAEGSADAPEELQAKRTWWRVLTVACLLLACIGTGAALWRRNLERRDVYDVFWSRILNGKKVVLFSMTDEIRDRLGAGLYPLVWISGRFGMQTVLTSGSLTGATTNTFAKARISDTLPDDLRKDTRLRWLLDAGNESRLLVRAPDGRLSQADARHAALVTILPENPSILYIQSTDQEALRKVLEELTEREHFPREIVPLTSRPLQILLTIHDLGHTTTQIWEPPL
jgi:hypothetical protein